MKKLSSQHWFLICATLFYISGLFGFKCLYVLVHHEKTNLTGFSYAMLLFATLGIFSYIKFLKSKK